jgi:hypothetical protein
MKDDFDLQRIADVPDPLAALGDVAIRAQDPATMPPSRTRSRVAAIRVTALGAALLYEGLWLTFMSERDDLHTIAPLRLFFEVAVPIGAAVLALTAASPGERGLAKSRVRLATLTLLAPISFMAAAILLSIASDGRADGAPFWPHCLRCFAWTSLYSAGPMVFAAWAFRRSFVGAPAWRTTAVAIACAATGAATMSLVCSSDSPAHVVIGHGGAMLVAALFGSALGDRFGRA